MKIPPLAKFIKSLIYQGFEYFGRYYSCYRGYVIDNQDPEGLQRLILLVPQVTGNFPFQQWAFSRNVYSGNNADGSTYGMQMLPQKGDIVWVEFEMGNPEVPIWSLGHPGNNDKTPNPEYQDPNTYWFVSPLGNTVIINDTKSYIRVILKGIDGAEDKVLEINQNATSLVHDKAISLGKLGASEHKAILGDIHNEQMKALYDLIKSHTHTGVTTGMGISGAPDPDTLLQVEAQKEQLDNMLSQINTLQ